MYQTRVQVSPPRNGGQMQTTDQSFFTNSKIFQCQKHQEIITNFSVQELKPLCPECISEIFANGIVDDHSIDSLKNVKMNCSKKIKTGVYELNRQLESSEIKYLLNPQGIIDEGVQEIQKCKKQIMRIIDFHFEQLFIQFKAQVQDNVLKASDLTYIFENIKQSIIELDQLSANLEQGNTIQSIVKVCQLDLKSLIDKFKSDIHKIVDSRDLDPIKIITNNNAINEIKRILPQVAVINKIHSHYHDHSPQRPNSPSAVQNSVSKQLNALSKQYSPQYENAYVPANPNNLFSPDLIKQQQQQQQQLLSQQIQSQNQQFEKKVANTQPLNQSRQEERPQSQSNINNNLNRPPHAAINPHQPSLLIRNKDYFNQNSKNKFLVSISDRTLSGVDLNLSNAGNIQGFFEVQLPEELPVEHSLLVTSYGDIIVTGGVYKSTNKVSNIVKRIVLSPDRKSCQIETVARLYEPRYAHSTIQFQDRIYVIGGFSSKKEAKNDVETIFIKDNKFGVDITNECKYKSAYPALAIIQDQYIVKIGGINENNVLNSTIERYNLLHGEWEIVDPGVDDINDSFNIFYGSGCLAINNDDIFVFGGCDEQGQNTNLSFILSFKNKDVVIRDIMKFPLPVNLNFINVQSFISDNLLYFKSLEAKKSLVCFNGQQWLEIL